MSILERIDSPADLRTLSEPELEQLAAEIREFIVDAVSRTGGHLGSNLGAVELTLALHRVFDSPRDRILWDTGHQAYVHKLVTGRRGGFGRLRQGGGLSGYPNRAESPHDWIENSHASTVLSWAHGMAVARDLAGDDYRIVAVIGDGSMTGGMAYEGLNNLGVDRRRVVVVLNDNGRSYAPTVSRLTDSVSRLRMNPSYLRQRERLERLLERIPGGGMVHRGLDAARAAIREALEPPAFFEALGVRYVGPIDGHDIAGLESALRHADSYDGPIVVHVLTQKGRGYPPAEQDEERCLHDIGRFDPRTGQRVDGAAGPTFTQAFTEALIKAGEHHPEVVAITAAMPGSTGLLPFQERFGDRTLDVGIAEQHAVTAAAGMAAGGLRPVVAVYSTFLTRAFDQVNLDVGLHRAPVIFAVDRAGITGDDGPSHHGILDLVLLTKVPGMVVLAPSSYEELGAMFEDALELDGPVAIRWPKGTAPRSPVTGTGLRARRVRAADDPGSSVAVLAVGPLVHEAVAAAEALAGEVDVTVWDVRVCSPLDPEMLADADRHAAVVTVEDGLREGGVGDAVRDRLSVPTRVLGVPREYIPHDSRGAIMARLGLDAAGIARTVRDLAG